MRITILSGGIGGARFVSGVVAAAPDADVTVVANTADDIWLHGLRVCPDLDSLMYTLGGGIDPERRWGRADETWSAKEDLAAYGEGPDWFGLGDRDIATHLVRTRMLREGRGLTAATAHLCERWQPGVTLLPMTEDEVETHLDAVVEGEPRHLHFQEYWIRYRAGVPFTALSYDGVETSTPAPGVTAAIAGADVVLVAPSNPVVSIGPILAVPGLADALRSTSAPVVGVSPIIGGGAVRGMADQLMGGLGREISAAAVAETYGSRRDGGLLDSWLVDDQDADAVDRLSPTGVVARAVPLFMDDDATTRQLAEDAITLGLELRP